jgi:hypothetical protein
MTTATSTQLEPGPDGFYPLLATDARNSPGFGRCSLCGGNLSRGQRVARPAGSDRDAHITCIAAAAKESAR